MEFEKSKKKKFRPTDPYHGNRVGYGKTKIFLRLALGFTLVALALKFKTQFNLSVFCHFLSMHKSSES